MRLWHKDLIQYLPRQQLLGQWRECCCIAKNIMENGTPNHILVNKVMDYPIEHFIQYGAEVIRIMINHNYDVNPEKFFKYFDDETIDSCQPISINSIFIEWHNDRYLRQCLYNLQEKADCNDVSEEEWARITDHFVVMS